METLNITIFFVWFFLLWFFVAYCSGVIVARKTYHKKIDSFVAFLYGFFFLSYGLKLVNKQPNRLNENGTLNPAKPVFKLLPIVLIIGFFALLIILFNIALNNGYQK